MQQAKRSRIRRILDNPPLNELISVYGWVKSIRESKSCAFIMLSDGSSMKDLQVSRAKKHIRRKCGYWCRFKGEWSAGVIAGWGSIL